MQYLLNAREMKQIDKNTIEVFGVPSLVLMERAALRVVEMIKKEAADAKKTLVSAVPEITAETVWQWHGCFI